MQNSSLVLLKKLDDLIKEKESELNTISLELEILKEKKHSLVIMKAKNNIKEFIEPFSNKDLLNSIWRKFSCTKGLKQRDIPLDKRYTKEEKEYSDFILNSFFEKDVLNRHFIKLINIHKTFDNEAYEFIFKIYRKEFLCYVPIINYESEKLILSCCFKAQIKQGNKWDTLKASYNIEEVRNSITQKIEQLENLNKSVI